MAHLRGRSPSDGPRGAGHSDRAAHARAAGRAGIWDERLRCARDRPRRRSPFGSSPRARGSGRTSCGPLRRGRPRGRGCDPRGWSRGPDPGRHPPAWEGRSSTVPACAPGGGRGSSDTLSHRAPRPGRAATDHAGRPRLGRARPSPHPRTALPAQRAVHGPRRPRLAARSTGGPCASRPRRLGVPGDVRAELLRPAHVGQRANGLARLVAQRGAPRGRDPFVGDGGSGPSFPSHLAFLSRAPSGARAPQAF